MTKPEIEELKDEIELYAERIEKLNPENIDELEEDEFETLTDVLEPGIIEQIKKHEINLFYSKLGSFYPYLETETDNLKQFLENYKNEIITWYDNELEAFEADAETVYNVYSEIFEMEEEEIASWYDDELDTCSWRTVYLSKANGVEFFRDVGGYGDVIRFMDEDMSINDIVDRLRAGETICEIFNDCYD